MAETRWIYASGTITPSSTEDQDDLIPASTFEDGELKEYTILKMFGFYVTNINVIGGDVLGHFGIRVANDDALASAVPPSGTGFDDEGFWMWKAFDVFLDEEDNTAHPVRTFETSTRRVVRRGEVLVITGDTSGDTMNLNYGIRILILVD